MPFLAPVVGAFTAAAATIKAVGFMAWLQGGSILAGLTKFGFSMAARYVLGALFQPKPQAQASQLETRYGDENARTVILGRAGTAGHHVFRNARGKGNRNVEDVHVLSHFRVSEIPRVRGDGYWRSLAGDIDHIPGIKGDVRVTKYYGRMDQTANAALVSNSGTRWKSSARGAGIAYAIVLTELRRDEYTQPWAPFFEVWGPYLYDWRKDSSVGGDGSDRWNDQDSWSGRRDNPVLQMYALERGIYNGTELIVGKGASASRLPLAEWTIAANICDEVISGRHRYSSSIIAVSGEGSTHDANMQPLLEACAASWVEGASGQFPIVGAAQAVVATFTDDDLIVGEAFRYSEYRPRDEMVNTAAGSYTDPVIFYERGALITRVDSGALASDGERLAVSLPFPAVTDSKQADELCDIALRANRYQANAEICLKPKFLRIQPGRWVRWNSAKYGDKTYLVLSKRLGAFGSNSVRNVYLTLQEVGAGIFTATGYETVPVSPAPPGVPDYQSEHDNFVVQPWLLTSEAMGERPALRARWDAVADTTIIGTDFEYWPTAQPDEVQIDSAPADFTVKFLTIGIISQTEYQVRYRLRSDPPRNLPWVGPFSVISPSADTDDIHVKHANLSKGVKETLQDLFARHAFLSASLEQIALNASEAAGTIAKESNVAVRYRNATAAAMQSLRASIEDVEGQIIATAEAITALQATVGDSGAGALWRMVVQAGEDDVVSRIELQVRATVADEWVAASTVWEAGFDSEDNAFGRIVLSAAQTMIADGEGNVVALFDEDGVHLSNAFIGNLTGDHIAFNTLTGDHIQVGSIDSPSLMFGAVTEYADLSWDESKSWGGGSSETEATTLRKMVVMENEGNNAILLALNLTATVVFSGTGNVGAAISLRRNGVLINQAVASRTGSGTTSVPVSMFIFDTSGDEDVVYEILAGYTVNTGGSSSASMAIESASGALNWKR